MAFLFILTEWFTALAEKRKWEFKSLQYLQKNPPWFFFFLLPIALPMYQGWPYSWNTEGKATLDIHNSGLWNVVRLLGFLRFVHKFSSDIFGRAPKQPPRLPAWTSQAPCMASCPSKLLIMTAASSWQGRHISSASRSRGPHIRMESCIISVRELWLRISSCAVHERIYLLFLHNCLGWCPVFGVWPWAAMVAPCDVSGQLESDTHLLEENGDWESCASAGHGCLLSNRGWGKWEREMVSFCGRARQEGM